MFQHFIQNRTLSSMTTKAIRSVMVQDHHKTKYTAKYNKVMLSKLDVRY